MKLQRSLLQFIFIPALLLFGIQQMYAQQMSAFTFQDTKGRAFTHENLNGDLPVIFFFFDPWCDHCAQQAEWIAASEEAFRDVELVWVTTEQLESTLEFKEKYFGNSSLEHLHFLLDTEFMFDTFFGYSEVISIYVYNAEGQRTKSLIKETPVEKLLRFL